MALKMLSMGRALPASLRPLVPKRSMFSEIREREILDMNPPLVLHCQFTRNNTILTLCRRQREFDKPPADGISQKYLIDLVRPPQRVVFNVSTGQLGFKGTKKSTYDAAFQTTAKLFEKMEEKGILDEREQYIELITRNFGENRNAFFDVLNGKEGTKVRPLIRRLTDGTRIKFGGDRSPNKRRV